MKVLLSILMLASFAFANITYQRIGGVPANNLCDNGSSFLTINPANVCVEWKNKPAYSNGEANEPSEWSCVRYQMQHLNISKEKDVCLEFISNEAFSGCTRWGKGIQGNKTIAERTADYGQASMIEYFDYIIQPCQLNLERVTK